MVSIDKNIQTLNKSFSLASSEVSSEGIDSIFAELFSLVDMSSIENKSDKQQNGELITFTLKHVDAYNKGQKLEISDGEINKINFLQNLNKNTANDKEDKSDAELNAAKSLVSIFYKGFETDGYRDSDFKNDTFDSEKKNMPKTEIPQNLVQNLKKKKINVFLEKNQKEELIKKETTNLVDEPNNSNEKKSLSLRNDLMSQAQMKTKNKKKAESKKIQVDLIFNEEEKEQNQTKALLIIQHKIPLTPKNTNQDRDIDQKLVEGKKNFSNNIKKNPQTNNQLVEKQVLDMMESSWGEKFVKIIKNNLNKGINKIDLKLEPNNLGKLKLEVTVDGDKTDIKINTENKLASNIINDNYQKLSDMLEKETLKLNNFSSMSDGDKNSEKEYDNNEKNKKNLEENKIKNNETKLTENIKKKTIHNVDINA